MLQLVGLNGIGLLRAMVEVARSMQAHPFIDIVDTEIQRLLLTSGDLAFWERQASVDQLPLMKQMDAYVGIRASQNIYEQADVSGAANKAYAKGLLDPVHFQERVNNTRWCIMRYPSEAFAMNAKMPTSRFIDFFYQSCLLGLQPTGRSNEAPGGTAPHHPRNSFAGQWHGYPVFRGRPELGFPCHRQAEHSGRGAVFLSDTGQCQWSHSLCTLRVSG